MHEFGNQATGSGEIKIAKRFSRFPAVFNDLCSENAFYLDKCDPAVDFA